MTKPTRENFMDGKLSIPVEDYMQKNFSQSNQSIRSLRLRKYLLLLIISY